MPRWSVAGPALGGILSMAGLVLVRKANVNVGPPLLAKVELSSGSVLLWLVPVRLRLASELRL